MTELVPQGYELWLAEVEVLDDPPGKACAYAHGRIIGWIPGALDDPGSETDAAWPIVAYEGPDGNVVGIRQASTTGRICLGLTEEEATDKTESLVHRISERGRAARNIEMFQVDV